MNIIAEDDGQCSPTFLEGTRAKEASCMQRLLAILHTPPYSNIVTMHIGFPNTSLIMMSPALLKCKLVEGMATGETHTEHKNIPNK